MRDFVDCKQKEQYFNAFNSFAVIYTLYNIIYSLSSFLKHVIIIIFFTVASIYELARRSFTIDSTINSV